MSLAILLLVDISQRYSDLSAHYSDYGVLPRLVLLKTLWHPAWFSWATLSGHLLGLYVFFLFLFGSVLSFAVGYQTRWSTLAVWLGLVSIQNRNPMILDSADAYLRLVVFWMIFLPLGARWSWDAKAGVKPPQSVSSIAYLVLALQLFLMLGQALSGAAHGWFFFAVVACAALAFLPSRCWDGPLAPLTRRWSQPTAARETDSLAVGIQELRRRQLYRAVFALFAVWVVTTNLMVTTRFSSDWDPSIMFLRLDLPSAGASSSAPLTAESGRFVMEGVLRDGTLLERADVVESSFDLSDRRWRNYLTALRDSKSEALLDAYGEFLCRKRWSSPRSLHGLTDVKVSFLPAPVAAESGAPFDNREELLLEYRMKGLRR